MAKINFCLKSDAPVFKEFPGFQSISFDKMVS